MKRSIILLSFVLLSTISLTAQNRIRALCANSSSFSNVTIRADGSIFYQPCPGQSNIFVGDNDFSGVSRIVLPSGAAVVNAGQAKVIVNNPMISVNSIILVMARSNDLTCTVKNYVPINGGVTINMTARCTAATSVGYILTN